MSDSARLLRRLEKLTQQHQAAEKSYQMMQGEHTALLKQLQQDFGISTILEAKEKLSKMEKDIDRRKERLEKKTAELEELVGV